MNTRNFNEKKKVVAETKLNVTKESAEYKEMIENAQIQINEYKSMIKKIMLMIGAAFVMIVGGSALNSVSANTTTVKAEVVSRNLEKHTIKDLYSWVARTSISIELKTSLTAELRTGSRTRSNGTKTG